MTAPPITLPPGWHVSEGDMAASVHAMDWSTTPLGSRAGWPESLRLSVEIVLASAFPMALRWGPDFVLIYNDAYRPILGAKHPRALGLPAREAWSEVWPQLEPAHTAILNGDAPAIYGDEIMLRVERNGAPEEAWFSLGYSPVPDPTAPSGVGGVFVTAIETTARRLAELALTESRSFLQDLLHASGEAFYAVDREGTTTLCNRAFLAMVGFERESDAVGRKLHGVIHHSHPDGAPYEVGDCPIYRCAATGEPCHVEDELFFRLNGDAFPVEYWAQPIYRAGVHQGAICTFIEISDRRAAREALAASEAQFRAFAQSMPNHVWTSRPEGYLDWFNLQAYVYAGMDEGTLHGEGWATIVHPDDIAGAGARWTASLASGDPYETEFRLRRADGAWRWHLARAIAIRDEAGRITRWIGTNTDIQDQKTTAQALASLNETLEARVAQQAAERARLWQNSQDLLIIIDAKGTILSVNPAWKALLGWTLEELVAQPFTAFIHLEDREASERTLARALDGPLAGFESRALRKDGGCLWISWATTTEQGLVYAMGRNIDAAKAAAAELAVAQEALRQSQKMDAIGQLTGGIAHDFNNMLAVVIGSLDLLGRRLGADERARRYVDAAVDGARRAALLTQRLLAFARQQPLQPKPVEVNKLVGGMSDMLHHSIGADIRLETVLAGGLWSAFIDPNQLENVILNLAVNARDAMPEGGRLTIETQNAHLDDRYAAAHDGVIPAQYVLIAVTDTGSGMPEDVIAKAFDPFFTTKEVGKGTGLGLSQVYGFIKQSGGHVKIYSEAGHGTTVKVYLRRLDAAPLEEPAATPVARVDGDEWRTILVVEDEPAVRAFTAEALAILGYTVLIADGAPTALRQLDTHPEIDLLFTDVVMPDMNGRRLADVAREKRPDLKILFTTGYTRNAVVHNGVLDAEVALIGKPFTVDELAVKVRAMLGAEFS